MPTRIKTQIVQALKADHRLKDLLRAAALASSTYDDNLRQLNAPDPYAALKAEIVDLFHLHRGVYGYRRIRADLVTRHRERGEQDWRIAEKTVRAMMGDLELHSCIRRKKRSSSSRGLVGTVAPHVLRRDFTATAPDQKWVTDVTQFTVRDQTIYLSSLMDLFDRQIIAYTVGPSPSLDLTQSMLEQALATLPAKHQVLVHSDQGFQYQHRRWQQTLAAAGAIQSMSRKATCLDNAPMESHFGTVKEEMFNHVTYDSVNQVEEALHGYIRWYNTERISMVLGGKSPAQFRADYHRDSSAATG